jgi:mono/diheme cytochrome c family protein
MNTVLKISAIAVCAIAMSVASAEEPAAAVYKAKCVMCHGAAGDASTPAGKALKVAPFTSGAALSDSDADMITIAKNGKGKMPAWKDKLSDAQLKDLVVYIRTLQKK